MENVKIFKVISTQNVENPAIHICERIYDSLGNMMGSLTQKQKEGEFIKYVEEKKVFLRHMIKMQN